MVVAVWSTCWRPQAMALLLCPRLLLLGSPSSPPPRLGPQRPVLRGIFSLSSSPCSRFQKGLGLLESRSCWSPGNLSHCLLPCLSCSLTFALLSFWTSSSRLDPRLGRCWPTSPSRLFANPPGAFASSFPSFVFSFSSWTFRLLPRWRVRLLLLESLLELLLAAFPFSFCPDLLSGLLTRLLDLHLERLLPFWSSNPPEGLWSAWTSSHGSGPHCVESLRSLAHTYGLSSFVQGFLTPLSEDLRPGYLGVWCPDECLLFPSWRPPLSEPRSPPSPSSCLPPLRSRLDLCIGPESNRKSLQRLPLLWNLASSRPELQVASEFLPGPSPAVLLLSRVLSPLGLSLLPSPYFLLWALVLLLLSLQQQPAWPVWVASPTSLLLVLFATSNRRRSSSLCRALHFP